MVTKHRLSITSSVAIDCLEINVRCRKSCRNPSERMLAITQSPQETMIQRPGRPATCVHRFVRPHFAWLSSLRDSSLAAGIGINFSDWLWPRHCKPSSDD